MDNIINENMNKNIVETIDTGGNNLNESCDWKYCFIDLITLAIII